MQACTNEREYKASSNSCEIQIIQEPVYSCRQKTPRVFPEFDISGNIRTSRISQALLNCKTLARWFESSRVAQEREER